ncbi:MAG: hypothetical protein NUV51_11635 [Sulfuricaulis sp.]|nr:hypothetical protein [Sulfuricaulis sp.]
MIPLSAAITKGDAIAPAFSGRYFSMREPPNMIIFGSDPLGAAYLGHLHPGAVESFWSLVRSSSHDSLCAHMLRGLHRAWPHLGSSVRAWPHMAEELERDRLIPRICTNQPVYRAQVHVSLWKVICDMHKAGESKEQVAAFLGRHGL